MTEHQYQQFRKADIIEKVCVRIASTFASNGSSSCHVSLQDIQDVFPDAQQFKLDELPIPFLIDPNGNRIEPPCIAFYPHKVLDVITERSQFDNSNNSNNSNNSSNRNTCNCNCSCNNSNSSSNNHSDAAIHLAISRRSTNLASQDPLLPLDNLIQSFNSFLTSRNNTQIEAINSNLEKLAELLLGAKEKDDKMINMLETKETMTNLLETKEEMINLLLETEEKNNEMIKLQDKMLKMQLEAREEKDDKIQHQALDKFTILQKHAHAILTQGLEPHECPIPRLFIILPVDHTKWDSMNVLKNKFRLHFLCECGNHTAMASKSTESQIHITKHKGYEIRDCKGFFHKYGKYMFILLQWLKLGMLSSAPLNCSIDYMETFSKKYPALNNITTIDDYEGLEEADLQQLGAFLRVDDEGDQFGNLYRITTESGHVKWVCFQHYRSAYKEKEQKAFENAVKVNGAKYDPHLGKVIATLKSRDKVIGFFDALTNARRVYELDITFDCDWAEPDLVVLEKALAALNVSTLRLGLERASGKADSTPLRYQTLVRIIELSNIKAIHIALSPDLIKLPSLRPGRSSHLHKLSFEMKVHQLEADELLVVVNYLKTNTALTALNLDLSRIKKKEVLALAEALKANTTLTTLGLESNLIGDEETLALAEALKANITLSTLTLAGDSIGNKGALALAEVLKANTTLTTLTLAGDSIGNKGALALLEALKGNTSLISLCLECDSIGEEGALALSEALEANTTLTYLGLWSNLFGKEEALLLSEVLKANTTLTGLNLHGNSLRDEGALALSEALKVNVTLVSLELERTLIGNEGARALAEALKVNATLVSLGLEENLIGNEGARALAEALKSNMTLTTVKLGRNFVGAKETLALSKLLKTNIILTTLDLESCW